MRHIDYKAKSKDSGEWVFGNYVENINPKQNHDWIVQHDYKDDEDLFSFTSVDPETVCQFTGLYDNKGFKPIPIYEKDILKVTSEEGHTHVYQVIFVGGMFALNNPNCCGVCKNEQAHHGSLEEAFCLRESVEKIGNIIDNPKLLEQ